MKQKYSWLDHVILVLISFWYTVKRNFSDAKVLGVEDLQQVFYIYDKLDERSLLAAAVLKKYSSVTVLDIGLLERITVKPGCKFVWIGFQPPKLIALKYAKSHHVVLLNRSVEPVNAVNISIISGNHRSITGQVFDKILMPMYGNHPEMAEYQIRWNAIGDIVEQFRARHASEGMVATSLMYIVAAMNYLTYGEEMVSYDQETILRNYLEAVRKTKKLLDSDLIPRIRDTTERLLNVGHVMAVDQHWFVARRLLMFNRQVLKDGYSLYNADEFDRSAIAML